MPAAPDKLLITGGTIYRHDADTDRPATGDILIEDGRIAAIGGELAGSPRAAGATRLDARGRLVLPGFVNAHYHSHDVLLKGVFEAMPLELWLLSALPPSYPRRSRAELRARTLLGAWECLLGGITTVQDLATLYPFDEEDLDVVLDAYREVGLRVVFALQVADVPGVDSIPYWKDCVPAGMRARLTGAVEPFKGRDLFQVVEEVIRDRRGRDDRLTWGLGPSAPERCSQGFLERLAGLSRDADLPVFTHMYESKPTALTARRRFDRDGGSLVAYLRRVGLLGRRLSLAHSVWMTPGEIEEIAETGTNVVLNPVGNLKTKSGVAPIRRYLDAGVTTALGCDNCSCSDAQNMFQAMKMFALLSAVADPEPGPPTAAEALRAATLNGARTAGLDGRIGAIEPGHRADLTLLDLGDPAFVPLNSVARQTVFTEAGRSVETVLVDGRVLLRDRRPTTIDVPALRAEVAELIGPLQDDIAAVCARNAEMMPHLLEAHRRAWGDDVGLNRLIGSGRA